MSTEKPIRVDLADLDDADAAPKRQPLPRASIRVAAFALMRLSYPTRMQLYRELALLTDEERLNMNLTDSELLKLALDRAHRDDACWERLLRALDEVNSAD